MPHATTHEGEGPMPATDVRPSLFLGTYQVLQEYSRGSYGFREPGVITAATVAEVERIAVSVFEAAIGEQAGVMAIRLTINGRTRELWDCLDCDWMDV